MRFDPFTGEPYKFDPFTGEPIRPGYWPDWLKHHFGCGREVRLSWRNLRIFPTTWAMICDTIWHQELWRVLEYVLV
jgi:hypothetical protein